MLLREEAMVGMEKMQWLKVVAPSSFQKLEPK